MSSPTPQNEPRAASQSRPENRSPGAIGIAAVVGLVVVGLFAFFLTRETPQALSVDVQIVEPELADLTTIDHVDCPGTATAASPLPNSFARTEPTRIDGSRFASGQIVVWNIITTANSTPSQPSEFALTFSETIDSEAGVICNFVSSNDPSIVESANPTLANWKRANDEPDELTGTLTVAGLEAGETAVVQLWTLIDSSSGQQPNLRLRLKPQIGTDANDASASVRASFKQPVEPTPGTLELEIDDGQISLEANSTMQAIWTITNTTTDRVFDFVDLAGRFEGDVVMETVGVVSDVNGHPTSCALADGGFLCNLGFVIPGERISIQATGTIDQLAESFYTGETGTCDTGSQDICSRATMGFLGQFSRNELELSEAADIAGDGLLSVAVVSDPEVGYLNRPLTLSVVLTSSADDVTIDSIALDGCPDDELELSRGDLDADARLDRGEVWEFGCLARLNREAGEVVVIGRTAEDGPAQLRDSFEVELIRPGVRLIRANLVNAVQFTVENLGDVTLTDLAVISKGCEPAYSEGDLDQDGDLDPEEDWTFVCQAGTAEGRVFAVDTEGGVVTASEVLAEDL